MTPHIYVQTDIPAGMTIAEWRAAKATPRVSIFRRLFH